MTMLAAMARAPIRSSSSLLLIFLFFFSFSFFFIQFAFSESYIVYMGCSQYHSPGAVQTQSLSQGNATLFHHMLETIFDSKEEADKSLIYSYKHCFNGFAAELRPDQALAISEMAGVVSVFPSKVRQIQTTRTWNFMGLEDALGKVPKRSLWAKSDYGRDVIIGVIDTGVWPESDSYSDKGMGPIPARWKGSCQEGTNFSAANCNKKLIGARYYLKGYEKENGPLNETLTGDFRSPRDKHGHGTHTSSTAGGRVVPGSDLFGFAAGAAKGGAPLSRLAMYKACWPRGCYDTDILAAFDAGIEDGVDVFSLSLGSPPPLADFFADGIAIGSFHAMQRGIPVVCSAGNDGPIPASVSNVAPWILTVAASTIDRTFPSNVLLGNGLTLHGGSLSEQHLTNASYPLVSAIQVKRMEANDSDSERCLPDTLDPEKTKGKIVTCLRGVIGRGEKGATVLNAGGSGMIIYNSISEGDGIFSDPHVLPATHITGNDAQALFTYINTTTTGTPTAYITPPTTALGIKPAPVMAVFSSQGPNSLTPDILKPDITAPGVNILAAWSGASGPSGSIDDLRLVKFNVISGTSMSCPHVAGIVALLKALHPDWSPAAIKSAIMTTGTTGEAILNGSKEMANPMNYGAGHINPSAAANPGLVYDMGYSDYFLFFLCNLGYNQTSLNMITGRNDTCPTASDSTDLLNLNYPSITVSNLASVGVGKKKPTSVTIRRTLTNVDENGGVYKVSIKRPPGVDVKVSPKRLIFGAKGEKKSFKVTLIERQGARKGKYVFGHFMWKDGKKHHVRTPIAVQPM